MAAPFLEGPLAAHTLDRLFRAEIAAFRREIEIRPVPERQDLRAGAVAWIAAFAPEVLSEDSRRLLLLTCEAESHFVDLNTDIWYRTVYLHAAQFALSGHPKWLDVLVTNLDHRTSQLRKSLHAPLGLVAPRLKLNSPFLVPRI